ncbi:MAG: alpha-hydroxy-acid oxidizing protein [Nitrososphaerota archaeon]|nr:alpha-hydroxy-acid oxidizing protein [Nitrososphaerota archaeon]
MQTRRSRQDEPLSIGEFEREARKRLSAENVNYIYSGAESEATLRRNIEAYSRFLLRRRVLLGTGEVKTNTTYFDGRIKSDLPFFPGPINVSPVRSNALIDILKGAEEFHTPIFISHLSIIDPLEISHIPKLVPKTSPLIWQIYLQDHNYELCFKQAALAKRWGYSGLTITVDAEVNIKLGTRTPKQLAAHKFRNVTANDLKRLRECSDLPLIVKGIMTPEDAQTSIENGADGIVVSNHGGRILDYGQSTIEVLPEIVEEIKSRRATRNSEIFIDGGIRRGTDILKALALGAHGCLLGRAIFYGLGYNGDRGVKGVMKVLRDELVRAASLCGVSDTNLITQDIIRPA